MDKDTKPDEKALSEKLEPLRKQIDQIDHQILSLLNQRADVAVAVGEVKRAFNSNDGIIKPEREAMIIRSLQKANEGKRFPPEGIQSVWREIISTSRGLESLLKVAYLGPEGSFSEQAAYTFYGHSVEGAPCRSFEDVFRQVELQNANLGMVPIENSAEGSVGRIQDLLLNTSLKVHGELILPIEHCLMNQSGDAHQIKRILAHPQTLGQCHHWLQCYYPDIVPEPAASNSEAARISAEEPSVAAIAGKQAAERWNLKIINEKIQDDSHNRTRFFAIGNISNQSTGDDQTSLIVAVPNRVGALHDLTAPFINHSISMTRFESRPVRNGQWEYYFFIDVLGHEEDKNLHAALEEIRQRSYFMKILGSYPRSNT